MKTATEYILAYQNQTATEGAESVELLVDFLLKYGMEAATVVILCQLIDEEGIAEDFGRYLRENGLVTLDQDGPAADMDMNGDLADAD